MLGAYAAGRSLVLLNAASGSWAGDAAPNGASRQDHSTLCDLPGLTGASSYLCQPRDPLIAVLSLSQPCSR